MVTYIGETTGARMFWYAGAFKLYGNFNFLGMAPIHIHAKTKTRMSAYKTNECILMVGLKNSHESIISDLCFHQIMTIL